MIERLHFATDIFPPDEGLRRFRQGANHFQVDPVGDPADFAIRWRMVRLGDINVVHSVASPVRYRRTDDMIAADGEDRVSIHCRVAGSVEGLLDGHSATAHPGDASIWDLGRTIDMTNSGPGELVIVTIPRFLVDEVLPGWSTSGVIARSAELAAAVEQALYVLDHADSIDAASAVFLGRAIRDMFAVAIAPLYRPVSAPDPDLPLLNRIVMVIDRQLIAPPGTARIAHEIDEPIAAVARCLDRIGGLDRLIERRRLLEAYRLLSDPQATAPVSTVAGLCGFDNLPRFSRRFRDTFHTSARDLRRHRGGRLPDWAGAYHLTQAYGTLLTG